MEFLLIFCRPHDIETNKIFSKQISNARLEIIEENSFVLRDRYVEEEKEEEWSIRHICTIR